MQRSRFEGSTDVPDSPSCHRRARGLRRLLRRRIVARGWPASPSNGGPHRRYPSPTIVDGNAHDRDGHCRAHEHNRDAVANTDTRSDRNPDAGPSPGAASSHGIARLTLVYERCGANV